MFERFFQYLQSEKRYSVHTIRAYESDLRQMATYMKIGDDELPLVTHRQLRGWFSLLMQQGLSARSINRKISSASTFFAYLVKQAVILQNPVEKVVNPKNSKRLPYFYKEEQLTKVLDAPQMDGESYEAKRDHVILELLYGTGMRRSELVGLTLGNIDMLAHTIRVLGKGNKQRIIPLSANLCGELMSYIQVLESCFDVTQESALFLTSKGMPIYGELVYRVVHGYLTAQGVVGKKSPHVLRHSFATHMLSNGADLNSIKDLLGHAGLTATQVYTHNDVERLRRLYYEAHPHADDVRS